MARTNKYSSINYNHIYERNLTNNNNPSKQPPPSSSSSVASYSAISSPNAYKNHLSSSSRTHGRMLVLTRPAAKPVSSLPNTSVSPIPSSSSQQSSQVHVSDQNRNRNEPDSDQISLRPLGRTGSAGGSSSSPILFHPEREKEILSPKPNKFVPPHLRPGFAGKEERPGPEVLRGKEASPKVHHPQQQQQDGGRPKSGGYERIRRGGGGDSDLGLMNRPRSSGNRPNSSG